MLDVTVQPPAQTRPGTTLYPPVAAKLSSETGMYDELSQMWAVATLVNEDGEAVTEQPGGKTSDSAHPLDTNSTSHSSGRHSTNRDQAYFYFPDLVIYTPGRYRIRVTLMRLHYSHEHPDGYAIAEDYVDSHSIVVDDGASNNARPSKFIELMIDNANRAR